MEVIIITGVSEKLQENRRFYYGWGSFACLLGLTLLILAITNNATLALCSFCIGQGIALILISATKPVLPLILTAGIIFIILGIAIYGTFVALINPVIILGLVIIAIGGGSILLNFKRSDG